MAKLRSLVAAGRSHGPGLAVGGLVALLVLDLDLSALVSYWGDRTILFPIAAAIGGLVWRTRLREPLVAAALVLGAAWLVVAFSPVTTWMARGLVRRDVPASADAVFVFGSRLQSDGDPTAQAQSRLLRGIEMVAAGHTQRLIVSEIPTGARHESLAQDLLKGLGVRGELFVVGPIRNTREEAVAVGRLCAQRGWTRILAVTSPTHSRRAAAALEREGLVVISVPCAETLFDLEALDRREERLAALGPLLHERVGLLWYRLRGYSR